MRSVLKSSTPSSKPAAVPAIRQTRLRKALFSGGASPLRPCPPVPGSSPVSSPAAGSSGVGGVVAASGAGQRVPSNGGVNVAPLAQVRVATPPCSAQTGEENGGVRAVPSPR